MGWLYNYCPGPAPSPTASIFPSPMDLVMLLALYFSFLDTLLPWNPPPPFCSEPFLLSGSSIHPTSPFSTLLSVPPPSVGRPVDNVCLVSPFYTCIRSCSGIRSLYRTVDLVIVSLHDLLSFCAGDSHPPRVWRIVCLLQRSLA